MREELDEFGAFLEEAVLSDDEPVDHVSPSVASAQRRTYTLPCLRATSTSALTRFFSPKPAHVPVSCRRRRSKRGVDRTVVVPTNDIHGFARERLRGVPLTDVVTPAKAAVHDQRLGRQLLDTVQRSAASAVLLSPTEHKKRRNCSATLTVHDPGAGRRPPKFISLPVSHASTVGSSQSRMPLKVLVRCGSRRGVQRQLSNSTPECPCSHK